MFMCIENSAFKRGRIFCVYRLYQLEWPTAVVFIHYMEKKDIFKKKSELMTCADVFKKMSLPFYFQKSQNLKRYHVEFFFYH